jgi:hypothetical protein
MLFEINEQLCNWKGDDTVRVLFPIDCIDIAKSLTLGNNTEFPTLVSDLIGVHVAVSIPHIINGFTAFLWFGHNFLCLRVIGQFWL